MAEYQSEYGVHGLTPLSRAVALRLAEAGQRVSLHDDDIAIVRDYVFANRATNGGLVGYADLHDFVASLVRPRVVVAGDESQRERLAELLEEGDRCIVATLADAALVGPAAEALAAELLGLNH